MRRFNHSERYVKAINSVKWQRTALLVRKRQDNLCAECMKLGIATPIDSVHHIVPAEEHASDEVFNRQFFNLANLVGLCRSHHEEADLLLMKGTREERKRRTRAQVDEFIKRLTNEG